MPFIFDQATPRAVGDALASTVRRFAGETRDLFAIGLITPHGGAFSTAAEAVADQTGISVVTSFAARDLAAGGTGTPLTAAADYLLARGSEDRLFVHLGAVASLLLITASAKTSHITAFDAGPGNHFLDALVSRCTRDKIDSGGTRAVQGRASDELLDAWSRNLYLQRKPPKAVSRSDFDDAFALSCIDDTKRLGLGLNDLLCTATHFVARCISLGVRHWLPANPRDIYLSGGGTRNGFLRQLLAAQFPGESLRRSDDAGIPTLARKASAAAVLAALTLDGVTGNLPHLTGAAGGRLIGRIVPGDPRNWAMVAAWAAEQMWDYAEIRRAA